MHEKSSLERTNCFVFMIPRLTAFCPFSSSLSTSHTSDPNPKITHSVVWWSDTQSSLDYTDWHGTDTLRATAYTITPYPMPRVDDLLERFGCARYLTTLDLCKGYWQVPLSEETTAWQHQNPFLVWPIHGDAIWAEGDIRNVSEPHGRGVGRFVRLCRGVPGRHHFQQDSGGLSCSRSRHSQTNQGWRPDHESLQVLLCQVAGGVPGVCHGMWVSKATGGEGESPHWYP